VMVMDWFTSLYFRLPLLLDFIITLLTLSLLIVIYIIFEISMPVIVWVSLPHSPYVVLG